MDYEDGCHWDLLDPGPDPQLWPNSTDGFMDHQSPETQSWSTTIDPETHSWATTIDDMQEPGLQPGPVSPYGFMH